MAEIRLRNLVKRYGDAYAVDHVSLTVADGEFVALVGPSGCGKTTTLNLIAGLIEGGDGDIFIGDRRVNDLDPKDRDIAMVFQNYALYPNKTVRKNMAFPLKMRKLPAREINGKVMEAARILDIVHLLERLPRELSGGQQQRVALGRAMVRAPRAFLMDEPLSNLDAKLRVQMRSELKRFHQEQRATMVYVTHDQLEAMTMADRMAVMRGGVLQQYDTPARGVRGAGQHIRRRVRRQPGDEPVAGHADGAGRRGVRRGRGLAVPAVARRRAPGAGNRSVRRRARRPTRRNGGSRGGHPGQRPRPVFTRWSRPGRQPSPSSAMGTATVVASVGAHLPDTPDDTVWLRFDPEKPHMFDDGTGLALPPH